MTTFFYFSVYSFHCMGFWFFNDAQLLHGWLWWPNFIDFTGIYWYGYDFYFCSRFNSLSSILPHQHLIREYSVTWLKLNIWTKCTVDVGLLMILKYRYSQVIIINVFSFLQPEDYRSQYANAHGKCVVWSIKNF